MPTANDIAIEVYGSREAARSAAADMEQPPRNMRIALLEEVRTRVVWDNTVGNREDTARSPSGASIWVVVGRR